MSKDVISVAKNFLFFVLSSTRSPLLPCNFRVVCEAGVFLVLPTSRTCCHFPLPSVPTAVGKNLFHSNPGLKLRCFSLPILLCLLSHGYTVCSIFKALLFESCALCLLHQFPGRQDVCVLFIVVLIK